MSQEQDGSHPTRWGTSNRRVKADCTCNQNKLHNRGISSFSSHCEVEETRIISLARFQTLNWSQWDMGCQVQINALQIGTSNEASLPGTGSPTPSVILPGLSSPVPIANITIARPGIPADLDAAGLTTEVPHSLATSHILCCTPHHLCVMCILRICPAQFVLDEA